MSVIERPGQEDATQEVPEAETGSDGLAARDDIAIADRGRSPDAHVPGHKPRRAVVHRGGSQGMRIRRVRLKSVLAIASVFYLVGYLVTIGTLVLVWSVARRLGFVTDLEDMVQSSLGLDEFAVEGADLFELALVGAGVVFAIGLVITVLMAVVYNAACLFFGGLAIETAPLRRPHRVFSLRHRSLVDVR